MTDKPPGALRYPLDSSLRGTGIPKGWSIKGTDKGINVTTPAGSGWKVPMGELRFLSPLVLGMLNLNTPSKATLQVPVVEWDTDASGVSKAPLGAIPIDVRKLSEAEIKGFRYHIGGAGIEPSRMKVADGYAVDLDDDGTDEKVLRAVVDEKEVVLILDKDDILGNRTFIYSTKHARNGDRPAAAPFAIKVEDQILFCWSGLENRKAYLEIVFSQDGSFVLK